MAETPTKTFDYRAFISYSHRDKQWGEWLHRTLENYRVPSKIVGRETIHGPIPRKLAPIFRDRDELATADDLGREITAALDTSMFLLVICSPASAQSQWVNEEIKAFKKMHGEGRIRAVIVEGEPFSGDPQTECFPQALRFKVGDDGEMTTEAAEPIAADLREGGDGKKYAISKLVAGLTGAKLDDLIQREQARRNARMRVAAGGMAAVTVAFAAIAWEASRQRDIAQVAQAQAVEEKDKAEGLVEFMLTDLRKELDAVGRLDILEMPGVRALEYYAQGDLATASADQLGRRARAQLLVGEVDNLRGDLDAALEAYTAAATTTEEQLRRAPSNPDRIFDHSQSVFWVGYIAWQRGDADTARKYWAQYYDHASRLVEIDPDNDDYEFELMYAHSNLGTLEMDQGNAEKAEAHFRPALEISLRALEKNPNDIDLVLEVGQSYAWLADALHRQTAINEARRARRSEIELYQRKIESSKNHTSLMSSYSIAHYRLAQIELDAGQLNEAANRAKSSVMELERLLNIQSNGVEFVDRASLAYRILGEIHYYSNNIQNARESLDRSIALAQTLVARDGTVTKWRRQNLTHPKLILGKLEAKIKNAQDARLLFEHIANELKNPVVLGNAEPAEIYIYADAVLELAKLDSTNTNAWNEVVEVLSDEIQVHGAGSIGFLVEAHLNNGQPKKALETLRLIQSPEYQHPRFIELINTYDALYFHRSARAASDPM